MSETKIEVLYPVVIYSRNNFISGRVQKKTQCHITSRPIGQRERIDVSGGF